MKLLLPLLDEALDLPDDAARQRWLDALPPAQAALAPRLRQLFAARTLGIGVLGRDTTVVPPAAVLALRAGDRVGPYRLVRELGRGGMSEVWLAEADDRHQVALKLPAVSLASQQFLERLKRERAILERLDHPGIARLIDAGVTDRGQHYLALAYVEGLPLDQHADAKGLDFDGRIGLVLQVLDALHYAHGRGVLHRDLKPANILVTARGEARLLDFGIAKILVDGQAHETELTARWGRAMTPAYASPEQRLGEGVTVRSDLYAVGVVLYELLTGTRPSWRDAEETVPPSRAITPGAAVAKVEGGIREAQRRLAGDLDEIVVQALDPDPSRRPADARCMADALARVRGRRPLHGLPRRAWRTLGGVLHRQRAALWVAVPAWLLLAVWPAVHDAAARIDAALTPPLDAERRVVLVTIGSADHRQLFGGHSPLDAGRLQQLVQRILDGGPATLGVDIDTSAPAFAALRGTPSAAQNVIWARDLAPSEGAAVPSPRGVHGADHADAARSGLALTLAEGGRVRWYTRAVDTAAGRLPAFGPLVAGSDGSDTAVRAIRFVATDRTELPAGVVLAPGFDWAGRVRGRIVLLGGRYDGTDVHATPLGVQAGIDILAQLVETEIAGRGYRRPGFGTRLALGVVPLLAAVATIDRLGAVRGAALALAASGVVIGIGSGAMAAAGVPVPWSYAVLSLLPAALMGAVMAAAHRRRQRRGSGGRGAMT
ncbi:protein kinase [Piscinibacter sp. XHJ-5]|uniref:protein kinase domain-containing protein n=1 Tax=Piscinibacter sp. XHJ-5 TaxID=3037797 RepID=UPI00245298D2|nr:protein kinase [Piscinibacter sp. XHJ-5]